MSGLDKLQPSLVKSLAAARATLVAAQVERIVRVERVGERIHEEELDEQARVRVRRTVERTIARGEIAERYAALVLSGADADAVVTSVREQLDADLTRLGRVAASNVREAIAGVADLVPADSWPSALVMADRPTSVEPLRQHLLSLGLRCAADDLLHRFGIVSIACPPDADVAAAVADSPLVQTMANPSAPVLAPTPLAMDTQMVEARSLLNVTPEMMAAFGHDVTLAVLDTGLDLAHPSFARVQPGDYRNFTRFEDTDDQGHGTHVASIAAGDDRAGRYSGMAPRAHLVVGKVIPGRMSGQLEDVLRGMAWAVFEKHADVLSLSIADGETPANGRSIWSRACDEAYRCGTLVCVAAGNLEDAYPDTVMVPADAVHAVAVGAIDKEKRLAPFSAKGSESPSGALYGKPNCVAPGVGIVAARASNADFERCPGNSSYTQLSGTSMAAPAVAGCLALVKSKARSLGWEMTPAELLDVFYGACRPLTTADGEEYSHGHEIGRGLPDVQQAFARVTALASARAKGRPAPVAPMGTAPTLAVPAAAPAASAEQGVPMDIDDQSLGSDFLSAFEREVRDRDALEAPDGRRFKVNAATYQTPTRTFGETRRYMFTKKGWRGESVEFSVTAVALKAEEFEARNGALRPRKRLLEDIADAFDLDERAQHVVGLYSPVGWPADFRDAPHDRGHVRFFLIEKAREPAGTPRWDVFGTASESAPLFNPELPAQEVGRTERALETHPELSRRDGIVPLRQLIAEQHLRETVVRAIISRPNSKFTIVERRREPFILRTGLR